MHKFNFLMFQIGLRIYIVAVLCGQQHSYE